MKGRELRRALLSFPLFASLLLLLLGPVAEAVATVTYQLREEQIKGTFVGNVERDMLTQGELDPLDAVNLKYTLSASGEAHAALFVMNETTSTVRTDTKIDREAVCPGQADCQVRLSIAVYKRGEGAAVDLFKVWHAVINIVDMNDNAPTFPQPFVALSVPESVPPQHVLRTSGAEDRDKGGSNSVQEYRLSPQSYRFGLRVIQNPDGSSDLGIVVKDQLDREAQAFYQLRVVVTDGGYPQRTGSLTVNITVTDINDNRPIFLRGSYNMSVPENVTSNTPVLQVSATDLDSGLNGQVTYSFNSRAAKEVTDHFQMDGSTGVISARGGGGAAGLDYESQQRYQFLVEARDQGSPSLSAAAMVILNVEDVNDNAPQININLTPGGDNVTEDEPVGKFVAHVSVSDRDSGPNSMVVCGMSDGHFTLQKFYDHARNMYKVLLSAPLDYEVSRAHRLVITCRDSGQPQLLNTTAFTVHVRDVNDNAPAFLPSPSYAVSVGENRLDPQNLLQVSARDPDTGVGGEVEYRLDQSGFPINISRIFSLDPVSGWLRVLEPLDREVSARYTLHVLAVDHGTPSLTSSARVVISVEDENDEKPYFTRSRFLCYILERQPAGTRVCNLTAVDSDSDRYAHMRFSIVQGVADAQLFSVNSDTGSLLSRAIFDREQRQLFKLMVKVDDPQVAVFYDLANVTVQILDDNDNSPIIHYPRPGNNSLNVSYAARERSLLASVNASDDDEGVFARLTYLLVNGDPSRLFDLGEDDGALRLARSILPSDVKEYVLEIEVKDGGNPPFVQKTELHVNVVAGNMTFLESGSGGAGDDNNILIVIVLVCITAVLALAVLITICLIRHIDKERRAKRSAAISKAEEEKMYRLKNQEAAFMSMSSPHSSNGSGSSSGGGNESSSSANGGGGAGGGRNRKKEVSFSLDEGVGSLNTSSGSGNNLSTFRSAAGDKHKELTSGENTGSHSLRVALDDTPHLRPVQEEEGCQYMEMLKRGGEDALSESSGETGTSDSGRGGSEDDSHSNRGSATITETEGSALYQHHAYPRSPAGMGAPSFLGTNALPVVKSAGGGRHPLYGSRHHPQAAGGGGGGGGGGVRAARHHHNHHPSSPHVSFSGNLEYLGETSTDDDHHHHHPHEDGADSEFLPPPPPDILEEPAPAPAAMERTFATTTFGSSPHSPQQQPPGANSYRSVLLSHPSGSHHAGYGGVSTSLVKKGPPAVAGLGSSSSLSLSSSPTPSLVVVDGVGAKQRWGTPPGGSHSGGNDDDDRTTTSTTSGSYILSHEDLPRGDRGDEVHFSNMIV